MTETLSDFMIHFLLSSLLLSIFIGSLAVLKRIFRRILSSRMQYRLWFLLFFLLPLPFLSGNPFSLSEQLSSFFRSASLRESAESITPAVSPLSSALTGTSEWMNDFTLSVHGHTPPAAGQILFLLWCAGIFFMTVLLIRAFRRLRHISSSALPLENTEILSLYESCRKELNIKRNIPVYTTAYLSSPAITGLFHPRIFLPLSLVSGYPEEKLRYMLLHELQHYRHKDHLSTLLMNLSCTFYWFHPAVWYALREMRIDREIACDTAVLELLGEDASQKYGATLLHFAEHLSHAPFSFATNLGGSMRQMKRRITNIAFYQPSTVWKRAGGCALSILIILLTIIASPALSMQAAVEAVADPQIPSAKLSSIDLSASFKEVEGLSSGTFVLYDLNQDHYQIYNEEQAYKRVSPNSTYKLYTALFGLEEGVITPENSQLPWDDHHTYPFASWNKDHTLSSAMSASVNWYFQAIDRELTTDVTRTYLEQIHYGNERIDASDSYWMESCLKISAWEQVSLLTDFYRNTFSFDEQNIAAVKDALRLTAQGDRTLYGKTGTGNVNGQNVNGWFIGYVESPGNTWIFATNLQADQNASGSTASAITLSILDKLGIWEDGTSF